MIGLFIGSTAALLILLIIATAYWWTCSPLLGGVCGCVAGFCIGATVAEAIATLHWIAAIDIPNPIINIPGGVTQVWEISPFILGALGAVVGTFTGAIRNKKN